MIDRPAHDTEGRRCILTTIRTLEFDAEERLVAEELADAILDALKREGLFIMRAGD